MNAQRSVIRRRNMPTRTTDVTSAILSLGVGDRGCSHSDGISACHRDTLVSQVLIVATLFPCAVLHGGLTGRICQYGLGSLDFSMHPGRTAALSFLARQ